MPRAPTAAQIGVPLALGVLELSHPTWTDGSIAEGVAAAGAWWIPLHLSLIVGYTALVWTLWPAALPARALMLAFLACNAAFLGVDGVAVGVLATANPPAADALWASPPVAVLADATGATWAAALLLVAGQTRHPPSRALRAALGVTWLILLAASVLPAAGLISRGFALAIGGGLAYNDGVRGLPVALLIFAAILPQHVGSEAAFGMLCLAVAALIPPLKQRSGPAASSPPVSG